MARVTAEDCLDRIQNQFELTMVASKRARQLARGANAHLPWEDDKTTVMALREIAEGLVGPGILDEADTPAMAVPDEEQAQEGTPQASEADAEVQGDDEAKPASE